MAPLLRDQEIRADIVGIAYPEMTLVGNAAFVW